MKFKTSITKIKDGQEIIRGHKLEELVKEKTFVESIYLLFKGEFPDEGQKRVLEAIFTSVIDHGPATSSALGARISSSAKNPIHASLAAGLLSFGDRHGMAVTDAMKFFYDNADEDDLEALLKKRKKEKQYVMGFGHKVLKVDLRSQTLLDIAKEVGVYGKYSEFALKTQETLNSISSRKLPLNIDGAVAAVLCDMGMDASLGNAFFLVGRVPGLLAHIIEEVESDEGIRRLGDEEIDYLTQCNFK